MGTERAAQRAQPTAWRAGARPELHLSARASTESLEQAVIGLQRLAGNQAVTAELASVQREEAAGGTPDFALYAEMWPRFVEERLKTAKGFLKDDEPMALSWLQDAFRFVLQIFNDIPRNDPAWIKVRIFGRGLDGVTQVLGDRLKVGKNRDKDMTNDIRQWRMQADELGPSLTHGPNGTAASIDKWKEGVVFPLGRTILKSERDVTSAVSEASLALEVIRLWRDGTPKDDPNRLQLANLERAVFYSLERLREQAFGKGEADVGADLDTVIAEAKVIGPQIGNIKLPEPEKAAPAAAPAPKKPFTNDTELMKPGD